MLGIIGGSGLTQLANLDVAHREIARTPWGEPSGPLVFGRIAGRDTVFLPRHGHGHTIPPHLVNYRANVEALRKAGATWVVSVASVGGIHASLSPGALVVPDQIIDYTWGRENSYQTATAHRRRWHLRSNTRTALRNRCGDKQTGARWCGDGGYDRNAGSRACPRSGSALRCPLHRCQLGCRSSRFSQRDPVGSN